MHITTAVHHSLFFPRIHLPALVFFWFSWPWSSHTLAFKMLPPCRPLVSSSRFSDRLRTDVLTSAALLDLSAPPALNSGLIFSCAHWWHRQRWQELSQSLKVIKSSPGDEAAAKNLPDLENQTPKKIKLTCTREPIETEVWCSAQFTLYCILITTEHPLGWWYWASWLWAGF